MTTNTDTDTEATTATTRKQRAFTPEQKQAASLRRDAAMLERLAPNSLDPETMLAHATALKVKADQLAPAHAKVSAKVTALTEKEWEAVEGYFLQNMRDHLTEGFSLKKLKAIAIANP